MMNKRGFLLSAASAIAAPQVLAAATPTSGTMAADGLPLLAGGLPAWQEYVGHSFELTDGHQLWAVVLQKIDTLEQPVDAVRTEQFVLGFINENSARIPDGVHRLQHGNGQSSLIHLADNGGSGRQSLRAEFNLLQPV